MRHRTSGHAAVIVSVISALAALAALVTWPSSPLTRGASASGAGYVPLSPSRILDTRSGIGAPATTVGPDSSIDLHVLGRAGIPDTGSVSAVAINVTAVDPTSPSYITVWPAGHPRPDAPSNLNVQAGTTIPNFVIAPIGNDGKISLYNERGNVHLLADVSATSPPATVSPPSPPPGSSTPAAASAHPPPPLDPTAASTSTSSAAPASPTPASAPSPSTSPPSTPPHPPTSPSGPPATPDPTPPQL